MKTVIRELKSKKSSLTKELAQVTKALEALNGSTKGRGPDAKPRVKRKKAPFKGYRHSPATKLKMKKAARKRWAKK